MKKQLLYQSPEILLWDFSPETAICTSNFTGSKVDDLEEGEDINW